MYARRPVGFRVPVFAVGGEVPGAHLLDHRRTGVERGDKPRLNQRAFLLRPRTLLVLRRPFAGGTAFVKDALMPASSAP